MKKICAVRVLVLAAVLAGPAWAQARSAPRGIPDAYVIGVEDQLRIVVWGEKDLTLVVKVRPDGKITVPLVNDIAVVGMTTDAVRQTIVEALNEYVREPNVTVIVEEILSYRVFFLGELRRQGAFNFYQPTRLLQGLAAAGGKTEFTDKVIILRIEAGVQKRMEFEYKKVVAGTQENIILEPGDTVVVKD